MTYFIHVLVYFLLKKNKTKKERKKAAWFPHWALVAATTPTQLSTESIKMKPLSSLSLGHRQIAKSTHTHTQKTPETGHRHHGSAAHTDK